MSHDITKVLLGTNRSSDRAVTSFLGSPVTFPAGTAVRLKSDKTLSVTLADGALVGVSAGPDLSDTVIRTNVFMCGDLVPIKLTDNGVKATGIITVSDYAALISGTDDKITLNGVDFVAQSGAATLGEGTFRAATSNDATATSLAAQITAYDWAEDDLPVLTAVAVGAAVTVSHPDKSTSGNDVTLTYTDNDTNVGIVLSGLSGGKLSGGITSYDYVVPGALVYVSDTTGLAGKTGSGYTVTGAIYARDPGPYDGVYPDATTAKCALIDMVGGL